MTNTSYLNLFPVRTRRRPSDVQRAAAATNERSKETEAGKSPFAGDRVNRAFDLMSRWHSKASTGSSLDLTTLPR